MKLKAKGNGEGIIEKFSAQSSKSAKFAKTVIKKREGGDLIADKKIEGDQNVNNGSSNQN